MPHDVALHDARLVVLGTQTAAARRRPTPLSRQHAQVTRRAVVRLPAGAPSAITVDMALSTATGENGADREPPCLRHETRRHAVLSCQADGGSGGLDCGDGRVVVRFLGDGRDQLDVTDRALGVSDDDGAGEEALQGAVDHEDAVVVAEGGTEG